MPIKVQKVHGSNTNIQFPPLFNFVANLIIFIHLQAQKAGSWNKSSSPDFPYTHVHVEWIFVYRRFDDEHAQYIA